MNETLKILSYLPNLTPSVPSQIPSPNAFVCIDHEGRVNIWPIDGGWLGAPQSDFAGDIAPFAG